MAFDPELATNAWLATLSGAARARSDRYFETGYAIDVADTALAVTVNWLGLKLGWAARLSRWAGRQRDGSARGAPGNEGARSAADNRGARSAADNNGARSAADNNGARSAADNNGARSALGHGLRFVPVWLLLTTLAILPWTYWVEFVREHDYGMSNQSLAAWAGDAAIIIAINTMLTTLLLIGVFAAVRRFPRNWWLGATGIAIAGLTVFVMIAPVLIDPLLNRYTPLADGPVKTAVLSMARANGVTVDNVHVVDASRQTKRISANVAGLGGTMRIALNDNLLAQPVDEIRAVMAHELGHYVLNHIPKLLLQLALLVALLFLFVNRGLPLLLVRFGPGWGVTRLDDPAILPVFIMLISVATLAMTPVFNTIIRVQEMEADRFGLNLARAPDAFASAAVKLGQYRKLEPGPWEEFVLYDHPSGRTRVETAMRWKAEHIGAPDIR